MVERRPVAGGHGFESRTRNMSQLNSAMTRFDEASSYHSAIHALRLRSESAMPTLTEEQRLKRIALIDIMIGLLEKSRDDCVRLGIHEWAQAHQEGG